MNDDEINGNSSTFHPIRFKFSTGNKSCRNDDVSQYTGADESISAPNELLVEFLSSVMMKNYHSALKYCKLILQFEPNHSTVKDFLPLLQEKCNQRKEEEEEEDDDDGDDDTLGDTDYSASDNSDTESEESANKSDEEKSRGQENGNIHSPNLQVEKDISLIAHDLSSNGTSSENERGETTSFSSLDETAEIQCDQMNDESLLNESLVVSAQEESMKKIQEHQRNK